MAVDYGNFAQLARGTTLVKKQQKMELPCIVAVKAFNDIDGNPLLLRTRRKFNFGDDKDYLRKKIDGVPVPTFNEQMVENNFSLDTKIKSYSYVFENGERTVGAFEWGIDTPMEELYTNTMPMPELAWYILDFTKNTGLQLTYIEPVDYKKLGLINHTGMFAPMVKNNGKISGQVYTSQKTFINLRTSEKDWWELSQDAKKFGGKENLFEKYPAEWQKKLISMTTTIIRIEDFQKNMVFCVRNNTNFYVQNKLHLIKPEIGSYKKEMVFKLRRGFKGKLANSATDAFRERGDEKKVKDFKCDLKGGSWVALSAPKNRILYFNEEFPFQEWEREYVKVWSNTQSWKEVSKGGRFIPTGGLLHSPFHTYEQYSKDNKTRLSNKEIASRPPHSASVSSAENYGKGSIRFSKFAKGTFNSRPKRGKLQNSRFMTPEMLLWYIANDIIVPDLKNPYYTQEETKEAFEEYIKRVKEGATKFGIKPTFGVSYQIEKDIDNLEYVGET